MILISSLHTGIWNMQSYGNSLNFDFPYKFPDLVEDTGNQKFQLSYVEKSFH